MSLLSTHQENGLASLRKGVVIWMASVFQRRPACRPLQWNRAVQRFVPNVILVLALLPVLAVAASKHHQGVRSAVGTPAPEWGAGMVGGQGSVQGGDRMAVLNQLLLLFATEDGADWRSYEAVAGIEWSDLQPIETPEVIDPGVRFSRSGKLTLAGFDETDLPDGNAGADAGVRRGNEGESGVTLCGDASRVNEVAVVKFYPSEDYEAVLRQQFDAGATIVPEADRCAYDFGTTAENTQKNKFYRVQAGESTLVHAEVFVEEESGPGSTTLVFYRAKPMQRIAAMQCHEICVVKTDGAPGTPTNILAGGDTHV
jgi:hypothetical protein